MHVLIYTQPRKLLILGTDSSNECTGANLFLKVVGYEQAIASWNKVLSKQKRKFCTTRKEQLAVIKDIENLDN